MSNEQYEEIQRLKHLHPLQVLQLDEPSMFLRDWFATHAPAPAQETLLNIHPEPRPVRPGDPSQIMAWHLAVGQWEAEARALWNYRYADAMLAARSL